MRKTIAVEIEEIGKYHLLFRCNLAPTEMRFRKRGVHNELPCAVMEEWSIHPVTRHESGWYIYIGISRKKAFVPKYLNIAAIAMSLIALMLHIIRIL